MSSYYNYNELVFYLVFLSKVILFLSDQKEYRFTGFTGYEIHMIHCTNVLQGLYRQNNRTVMTCHKRPLNPEKLEKEKSGKKGK